MALQKRRFPFYVSILCVFLLTIGGLSAALIYIGSETGNAIRIRTIENQMLNAEQAIATTVSTSLTTMSRTQRILAGLPVTSHKKLILGHEVEELLPSFITPLETGGALVSTFIGYDDGSFFYVSDINHIDRNLEIAQNIPDNTKYIILIINRTGGDSPTQWQYYDEALNRIDIFYGPAVDYDPRSRDWYREAIASAGSMLSKPYVFSATGKVGITLATAFPSNEAVVGAHYSVNEISRSMKAFDVSPSSVAFLIGEDNTIIGHPYLSPAIQTAEGILRPAVLSDYDDPILSAVSKHIANKDHGRVTKLHIDGKKYVTYVSDSKSLEGFKFTVGFATPESDLTGEIDKLQKHAAMITFIVMGISVVILLLTTKYLSSPINRLTKMAHSIANLDLRKMPPIETRIKEIAYLSDTMERMRDSLSTFGQYVPHQLVKRILINSDTAKLGGEKREVTVMFSDVQGFTRTSETMDPEEILPLISSYFQVMTDCIMEHQGIVDKFIGDAVMAIWNAPDYDQHHIVHACQSALKAKVDLEEFNKTLEARNLPSFFTRIGLNTGVCVVGNVGSDDRKDYTIFGPMVNMAARMESLNKDYGTQILVTDVLFNKVKDKFEFRYVDQVIPKGAKNPMDIYELIKEKQT